MTGGLFLVRFMRGIDWLCVVGNEVGNLRMYKEFAGIASGRRGSGNIKFGGIWAAEGK